jgi:uncharacterized protein
MRSIACAVVMACLITASGETQTIGAGPSAREPEITATGFGETRLAPTFAVITVGVTTRAASATEAATQNAAVVATAMSALRAAGVTADNLTNQGYNVEPAYEDNGRRRNGFIARNSIRAQIDGTNQAGRIIDAALAGGATEITSVQFGAPHLDDARREAMKDAVRRARADAELIAGAAGGALGRVISLTAASGTQNPYGQFTLSAVMTSGGAPVPTVLSPRDITVSASASGRWEFIPGPSR